MKKEILEFYSKFSAFSDMVNMSYLLRPGDDKLRALRQVKAGEVEIVKPDTEAISLKINLTNQLVGFIEKKVSPIVKAKQNGEMEDQNKLYLAIAFIKVYFEENDSNVYLPLLLVDITSKKEEMFRIAKKTGRTQLNINFEDEVIVNEEVVKHFYNISYEENDKTYMEYIATTLGDFLPEDFSGNVADIATYTKSFFSEKEKGEYPISYPVVNNSSSSLFMFFSSKNNFKQRREFEEMSVEKNSLVEEYLTFTQEKNSAPKLDNSVFYGTLTRDYPLGHGQAIVLQENEKNKRITPVVGAPGTGKTTLFLSLIANNVTKRAMANIFEERDYSNLMLVTSTSNKAVENVYKSLKKGWKHGFCYVGGNSVNKNESAIEVAQFIEQISREEYSEEKFNKYETSIKRITAYIDTQKKYYEKIHGSLLKTYKFYSYSSLIKKASELEKEVSEFNDEAIDLMGRTLNKLSMLKIGFKLPIVIEFMNKYLAEFEEAKQLIEHSNILSKVLGSEKKILAGLSIKIESKDILDIVVLNLQKVKENQKEWLRAVELEKKALDYSELLDLIETFSQRKKVFDQILKVESFGEYFRTNLFSLNYKLYIQSYSYLYQKMLKEKFAVLRALGYLSETENQFKYLVDNFGTSERELKEFLRLISLAYPVVTSTLAAVTNMFPGVFPDRIRTYESVLADEAGMIAVNDLLPALRRADRAIIVGDPKQLSPIVSLEETFLHSLKKEVNESFWNQYSPTSVSAFHRAAGTFEGGYKPTGRGIMLDEHRRCSPQIANLFIKIAEYEGLKVCTPVPTSKAFKNIGEQGLMFLDIKNNDINGFRKVNQSEIAVISTLLKKLHNAGYNLTKDVGIITPYREQEQALIKAFGDQLHHGMGDNAEAKIGTVHKFQGVEYKIIIFSSVVSRSTDTLSFINQDCSLINVAVSRAKESFIAIGDYTKITESNKKDNFIGTMAKHIKSNGKYSLIQALA